MRSICALALAGLILPVLSLSAETVRCTPDVGRAFRAAVERVRAAGGGTIDFEKGDYDFDPKDAAEMSFFISNHDQSDVHHVQLPLVGVTNLTVRGHGARFFFKGDVIAMTLLDTENVRVEDLSIDFRRPFLTEAKVVGQENGKTRLAIDRARFPYRLERGRILLEGDGWTSKIGGCVLLDRRDGALKERVGSIHWTGRGVVAEPDGTILADFDFSKCGAGAVPGDTVVLRPEGRSSPGVVIYRAKDSVFEDVRVHTCRGMAFIVQRSDGFTLRGTRTAADRMCGVFPSEGRLVSAHADATHFSNVKGSVRIENCLFAGQMDDAINVHATCLQIEARPAPRTLRCRYIHKQAYGFETFRLGEVLRMIRAETMEPGETFRVEGVETVDPKTVVLTLSGDPPSAYGPGDAVENADYFPSVAVRGCILRGNRARGALFTTTKRVLFEGNRVERCSGAALDFAGDTSSWFESGACADVLVTNNVFRNCTTSRNCHGESKAVIAVLPNVRRLDLQKTRYHQNVRIVSNRFETFDVPLLFAISCSNLVFRGNTVVRNADYAGWGDGVFLLQYTEGFDTDCK